jgi:hypothetical protein
MSDADTWLRGAIGALVVLDLDSSYLAIGRLLEVDAGHIALADADLHDHQEANCTKEVYLLETQKLGVRANRKRVFIPRSRLLAMSRLEDVIP